MESQDWMPEGVRVLDRPINGTADPYQERPNPLRRVEWVSLGDDYPGLEVKLWLNPPRPLVTRFADVIRGDAQRGIEPDAEGGMLGLLQALVLDHRDGEGKPWRHLSEDRALPHPSTDEFWQAIPDEVLEIISLHLQESRKKVKASVARIFGGSTASSSAETLPSETGQSGSPLTTNAATSPSAGTATPEP